VNLLDEIYIEQEGIPLAFDLFMPEGEGPFPLVITAHGGGWISGDKTMYHQEAEFMVQQGIACACVEYRLAPLHPFPACVTDLQDFVLFARSKASEWNVDPSKFFAFGNSAGGHLALMMGLPVPYFGSGTPNGDFKVDGVIAICPITDITEARSKHYPIAHSFLEQFLGDLSDEDRLRAASPITYATSDTDTEFCILHGDHDDIVPIQQSRDLIAKFDAMGIKNTFTVLTGEYHSFSYSAWMDVRDQLIRFVRSK